ncbi:UDP-N-acetylglucosamine--LPS N-acetylglucosamine transferase [Paenibacillus sp. HJL G12]|uniref:UDP-N-acetylglucosamine--LPS N-acetylglucosamine transferase n=1 Tax=Paenibacillus dendrobii TaxID=2691084 RepID=A0A7X3LED1_9BACL|nr:glycosyltransferase [Paenibacillus dendrobii]MWV42426.1 UDP-N-acetylglucosamine--LPS N-acetylglucosamine transferase [Paenibacillus dendrobii]
MRKKRVLILSEGFGSGHTQAGYALAAGMKRMNPNIQTKVIELGSFLNPTVAPWILSAYRLTIHTNPGLVGLLYRKQHDKPLSKLTTMALHRIFYHHTAEVIEHLKPDLIVSTHPIPTNIISRLKSAGLDVPLYTIITDYDAHASWINAQVDRFLVSTDSVRNLLLNRGVYARNIQVTGIPVHPDFWSTEDKTSVRRTLKIKDMPTVFIMGGGWGLVSNNQLIQQLLRWKEQVQLVFCLGSNQKLLDKMRHDPKFQHGNIVLMGHTSEISKWMDASDLLITKPGGMTCTEALAKGLPMLFCESLPGQEEMNREYFVNRGYGEALQNENILEDWLRKLARGEKIRIERGFQPSHFDYPGRDGYNPSRCASEVVKLLDYSEQQASILSTHGIPVGI